jgi:hypothetical protein
VSSMPYLKGDAPSQLDVYVPQITRAYITSRLESVQAVVLQGVAEDPLDNEEQLQVGRGVGRNGICALGGAVGVRVVQGGAGFCSILTSSWRCLVRLSGYARMPAAVGASDLCTDVPWR